MGKSNRKQNKKTNRKKEIFIPVLSLVLALIFALPGFIELSYYRKTKNNCRSEITGIVDYEGYGILWEEKHTVEGKYLSTGKSAKYWIKIIVNTDGIFKIKTLYAGRWYGNEGDELVIHYNPENPEEYYIGDYVNEIKVTADFILTISGSMLVLSVFLMFYFHLKKRYREEKC